MSKLLTGAISVLGVGTNSAATISTTFVATNGDKLWSTSTNWNPDTVPNNAGENQYLVEIPAGSGRVTLDQIAVVDTLKIGSASELFIQEGDRRLFPLGPVTNDGLIIFSAEAGSQRLQSTLDGDLEFQGSGTILLQENGNLWGQNGTNSLINGLGHRIEGAGKFNINFFEAMLNEGSFVANIPGEELWLNIGGAGVVDLKGGEFCAENGGILVLPNTVNLTASKGGKFTVGDESEVRLLGGSYEGIEILSDDQDGSPENNVFRVAGSASFRSSVNRGWMELGDGSESSRTYIVLDEDSFYNAGTIALSDSNSGFGDGGFLITGTCSLEGTGRFLIDDELNEGVWSQTTNDHFIHGVGHTIEGKGVFGIGGGQIERFNNYGSILANGGGRLTINAGLMQNEFINEADGLIRVENDSEIIVSNLHTALESGVVLENKGQIEVKAGSLMDLSGNPTLGNIRKDSIVQSQGEIRSDGEFEGDLIEVSGGVISGGGEFRFRAAIFEENVTIRPGNPIGRLLFADNAPTWAYPGCGGIFSTSLVSYADAVQLGGATLDLDIESPSSYDSVQFGETAKAQDDDVYATGSVRLKLNMIGDPANFGPGVEIPIVTGAGFTTLFRASSGGFLVNCGGSNVRVDNGEVGGLTVANLPADGRLTTYDGRATFKVVTDLFGIKLTEPFFTPEVPASNLTFEADTTFAPGRIVATVPVPAGITGTPRFGLIGDGPFDINVETGEIFVQDTMGLITEATEFQVTVSVYDGDHVQVNPTTITVQPAPDLGLARGGSPGTLRVNWNGGKLFEAESLQGPWKEVVGARTPFQPLLNRDQKFWQVRKSE